MSKTIGHQKVATSAQEHAANFTPRMRSIALVIVSLAFVMDLLDGTIVNIAIPSIQVNLATSYAAIQWIIAGYSLAFALLLVTGGRMGDVFGYKKLFMIGIGGFTIASLLSGVSPNTDILLIARLLQGAMAALMVPQVLSLMQIMYKPEERGVINGLFGMLGGISASLGPVIGGLLIKANVFHLDWRPIFLINVPVGLFGLIAASKYLPNGKSSHPLKLDITGTIIIMVALTLLVFPLIQGRELNWPLWSFIMMVASLPVFYLFVYWQKRKDRTDGSPLVLPALFKSHAFSFGLLINLLFQAAMLGYFLTFGLFLQIGLGFSAIHAALTGIPTAIGIAMTMALLGETLIPKLGRRALNVGTVVMAIGLIITTGLFHHYTYHIHSWQLIPGLICIGIGMGFVFGSLYAAVLNGVDTRHAGSASGVLNAVQQVGGAIGIAIVGVIFFGQLNHGATASFAQVSPTLNAQLTAQHIPLTDQKTILNSAKHCFIDRSSEKDSSAIPASCKSTSTTPNKQQKMVANTISQAAAHANAVNFDNAFHWAVIYEICILVLTFGLASLLPSHFKASADPGI
jgi:EmrB/QacA subfamily drug resistance transporter